MTKRVKEAVIKGILISLFTTIAGICSYLYAQTIFMKRQATYVGFDYTFGVRSFTLHSDIAEINNMSVLDEGGSAGFVIGNDIAQLKLRQGFLYTADCVPFTADLFETELNININPLQIMGVRFRSFDPYVVFGIDRDAVKFAGSFIAERDSKTSYLRHNGEQDLGKIVVFRPTVAGGVQYQIPYQTSFLKIFAEASLGYSANQSTREDWFKNTRAANQIGINVGVSFGYLK